MDYPSITEYRTLIGMAKDSSMEFFDDGVLGLVVNGE
jgi:hypothetical protein